MKDGIDVTKNLGPAELFRKYNIQADDLKFLMKCAMIFTMPVIIDDKPAGNLPKYQKEVD